MYLHTDLYFWCGVALVFECQQVAVRIQLQEDIIPASREHALCGIVGNEILSTVHNLRMK